MARKRSGLLLPIGVAGGLLIAYVIITTKIANKQSAPYLGTVYPPSPPSAFQPQAATMQSTYD